MMGGGKRQGNTDNLMKMANDGFSKQQSELDRL